MQRTKYELWRHSVLAATTSRESIYRKKELVIAHREKASRRLKEAGLFQNMFSNVVYLVMRAGSCPAPRHQTALPGCP